MVALPGAIRRRLKARFSPDHVDFEGWQLPPPQLRYCGAAFRDDATFMSSARAEAQRLLAEFGLARGTHLLEIGCGPGRLPIGILAEFGEIGSYDGVDIDAASIRWCRAHITPRHPTFRFHHVDAQNQRYNPGGRPMNDSFHLPFSDADYDLVYMYAVFTNMEPDDVRIYARETYRLLKPGGRGFLTAFAEESVPAFTINPNDHLIASTGPLHVAQYEKGFLFELLTAAGLEVEHFGHHADLGGQSTVHVFRPD